MATKTIDHMDFYVAIAGYQLPSVPDQTFNSLRVSVGYRKGSGFYASFHPGWGDGSMYGCVFDFSKDPLSAGITVEVEPATKNNAKRIAEMTEGLKIAKADIAWLFDERMWPELKAFVKDVALCGYTPGLENRMQEYRRYGRITTTPANAAKENNSSTNENSTTMEKSLKAADLIGKVIIIGGTTAKYIVKSVDGDKLSCDFVNDGKTVPMSVPVSQVEKFIAEGKWTVEGEAPSADVKTDADIAEVQDIVPVVTPKAKDNNQEPITNNQPAAKVEPIEEPKAEKPKSEAKPKPNKTDTKPQTGARYVYATYKTRKGKTGAKVTGFAETDAAYTGAAELHASASYERDKNGNKQYYLCFGPRYAEAAKAVCQALNDGKSFDDCKAIVDAATEERSARREEYRARREERTAQSSNGYTKEDVAEMLRKVLAGGDVPEDIKALLKKAA